MLLIFSPLHGYPNVSISRELFWNLTPVACRKLRCCHARAYNEKRDVQAQQLVFNTDFMTPPILLCPKIITFL